MKLSGSLFVIFFGCFVVSCATPTLKNYTGTLENPYLSLGEFQQTNLSALTTFSINTTAFDKFVENEFKNKPSFWIWTQFSSPNLVRLFSVHESPETLPNPSDSQAPKGPWWKPLLSFEASLNISAQTNSLLDYKPGSCVKSYKKRLEIIFSKRPASENNVAKPLENTGLNSEQLYQKSNIYCSELADFHFKQVLPQDQIYFISFVTRNNLLETRLIKAAISLSDEFLAAYRYKNKPKN
jgi:hypothetical protein